MAITVDVQHMVHRKCLHDMLTIFKVSTTLSPPSHHFFMNIQGYSPSIMEASKTPSIPFHGLIWVDMFLGGYP